MRAFARAIAVIALVAILVAFADPSSRPTVGRVAVFAVAVAAAVGLTSRVSRIGQSVDDSAFAPRRTSTPRAPVPTELAELAASFRALEAGGRVDAQLRSALHGVAESRVQRHGLSLDRPEHETAVRELLGEPLVEALRSRTTPSDPDDLLSPLEAL